MTEKNLLSGMRSYGENLHKAHIPLGHLFASYGPDHSVALTDVGALPYYSKWTSIDTLGLNDREIALTRKNGKNDTQLVLERHPEVIIFTMGTCQDLIPLLNYEIDLLPEAKRLGYEYIGTVEYSSVYWLYLMAKPSLFSKRLQHDLQEHHLLTHCSP